jgi:hypothetical protein
MLALLDRLAADRACRSEGLSKGLDVALGDYLAAFLHDLGSHLGLQPGEGTIDCLSRPGIAGRITEQLAVEVPQCKAPRNIGGPVREIHNSRDTSLRLARREDPAVVVQVNVPGLDAKRLLRPAAGLPCRNQEIAEAAVGHSRQNAVELLLREHQLTFAGLRLLHVFNWVVRVPASPGSRDRLSMYSWRATRSIDSTSFDLPKCPSSDLR